MKKRWKLSRGKRTIINLVLSALLLVLTWGLMGCPLPTAEMEFRRMERTHLLPRSEIQGIFLDGCRNRTWQTVGVQEDRVVLLESRNLSEGGSIMSIWPGRTEGATLVPIPWNGSEFEKERDIVAVDVPEGTASARLELNMACWYQGELWEYTAIALRPEDFDQLKGVPKRWDKTYIVEGELLKDGGVLFRVVSDDEGMDVTQNIAGVERRVLDQAARWETYFQGEHRPVECHVEAVFFDGAGAELGRAALATPGQG
ncbi:MAG: hypothetical protein HFF45_04500 [Lawsonibacter sp.]|nr:hypothetical protein [Lawsonibacter sp.]